MINNTCRPGLYSKGFCAMAMKLLARQIISGNTQHLLEVLRRWRSIEIRLLFLELVQSCKDLVMYAPSFILHFRAALIYVHRRM